MTIVRRGKLLRESEYEMVKLPTPHIEPGSMSLEEAISRRRSRRNFSTRELTVEQLSQLLWSAQGITNSMRGLRAAPSAGATFPLILYVAIGANAVVDIQAGLYQFDCESHQLDLLSEGDHRRALAKAALGQDFISEAPASIIIAADYKRTTQRYGERGVRYTRIDVGHAGENIYLQAEALGLATVAIGAFRDEDVAEVLNLPPGIEPLYIMPVGYAKT